MPYEYYEISQYRYHQLYTFHRKTPFQNLFICKVRKQWLNIKCSVQNHCTACNVGCHALATYRMNCKKRVNTSTGGLRQWFTQFCSSSCNVWRQDSSITQLSSQFIANEIKNRRLGLALASAFCKSRSIRSCSVMLKCKTKPVFEDLIPIRHRCHILLDDD